MAASIKSQWALNKGHQDFYDVPLDDYLRVTSQDSLPQSLLLRSAVDILKDKMLEAYLRGSFSFGEADEHSDIDLFLVVEPEKIEEVYDSFISFLKQNHSVIVNCHDRLVKDYGGIGFMFVVKDAQERLYQFDLYMAMKGVPPKTRLFDCQRVYSADPAYCWLKEHRCDPLPEKAKAFIERHTGGQTVRDELRYQMYDLLVALNIMKKHLQRGQVARSLLDNNHIIGVCVEMLRALNNERSPHTSLYAADKLLNSCLQDASYRPVAASLRKAIGEPTSLNKVVEIYDIGVSIIRDFDPELYKEMLPVLTEYKALVIDPIIKIDPKSGSVPTVTKPAP